MIQGESATNGPTATLNTVQLEQACKDYRDGRAVPALRDIDLTVTQGERVAIMRVSGSSKSSPTSFMALTGIRR